MANPDQPIKTCILKVNLKCCTNCLKWATMKLQSISGVNEVKYNSEKGLMTVTGDVEPLDLVRTLTKRKKTELFSVKYKLDDDDLNSDDEEDTSSESTPLHPDPKIREPQIQAKMMQKNNTWLLRKPSLLGCVSSKCSRSKVVQPIPMQNGKWRFSPKFQNVLPGFGFPPYPVMPCPQPIPYGHPMTYSQPLPYAHPMQQRPPPMPQQLPPLPIPQQPQVTMTGAAMPYNGNMFMTPNPPYYRSKQAQTAKVNPKLHYQ